MKPFRGGSCVMAAIQGHWLFCLFFMYFDRGMDKLELRIWDLVPDVGCLDEHRVAC